MPATAGGGPSDGATIALDLCGMSCPGPIVEVARAVKDLADGQCLQVVATDPGFARDIAASAQEAGVRLTACQMSMEIMGITAEELIDGVEIGGVATMLNDNDRTNMNLFI
ncbi:MAG: DsrE/DsrF/DrsH-like family protein [Actinomyces sp.]|uniref:DsrE/DsrF/DrsH-like family protein n=1 Tax=Actinomyces sp. TaxID=29317 RepID=UPI0026DC6DE4|nr:DsrE/DsrF/DrsH-like family protein [Actinomyces sp.]MDO4242477.1 DsrE/DsrF/DrsH-like family protein [Actinomyces sp.]